MFYIKKYHLLTIYNESQKHEILLQEPTYSIGRDANNKIVINHRAISRRHALLFRVPINGEYIYRFLDGDEGGRASANGTVINNKSCAMKDLESGDIIVFGGVIRATYQMISVEMKQEQKPNRNLPYEFKSIKAPIVDPFATSGSLNITSLYQSLIETNEEIDEAMPTVLMAGRRK